ncbi:MAG: hypothetical protein DRO39_05970 [Thermoprotei archaeon]|nr:MAG: hypothetical protein DRO39_05970 [Thermoprotei archaeon]
MLGIWGLAPIVCALEPRALRRVVAEKTAVLSPDRPEWSVRFGPGWFERLGILIVDGGRKVGKYLRVQLIREGLPAPDFDMQPYWLYLLGATRDKTNPGLTRYDPDAGRYAIDMDFARSPHPFTQPYYLRVEYPSRKEVAEAGDAEALASYGAPVTVRARYAAWEARADALLEALGRLLRPVAGAARWSSW